MNVKLGTKGTVTEYGYRRIRCTGGKFRFEHVIVWELHFGPVPPGFEIHHVNGDKLDNRIENLKVLSRLEHKRIHSGCYRVGDRWLKRCTRCKWLRPVDTDFYVYPGKGGVKSICRRCHINNVVEAKKRRRAKLKKCNELENPSGLIERGNRK